MEKEFLPYELAFKLKELGFNEECFGFYNNADGNVWIKHLIDDNIKTIYTGDIKAPLWQQVFDWFREKHNLSGNFDCCDKLCEWNIKSSKLDKSIFSNKIQSKEEARQACLEKLIELCQQN